MFPVVRPLLIRTSFRFRRASYSFRLLSTAASARNGTALTLRAAILTAFAASTLTALVVHSARTSAHLDAPPDLEEKIRIDPDTNLAFPETLVIPSKAFLPPFTLLGVGVRRVSFLGVKVYSVGFYADLSNPNLKIPLDASPEQKVEHIISNSACILRIVPTRSTSYTHLRDGFLRALQARMSLALKSNTLSQQDAELAQSPLRKLKALFPNTPLAKGDILDIVLNPPPTKPGQQRTLTVRDLGVVESDWVAKQFFMAYFEGDGISPPMKKSVLSAIKDLPLAVTR